MIASQVFLCILLLVAGYIIYKLCDEQEHLKRKLVRYENLESQEEYNKQLEDEIANKHNQAVYLEEQYEKFSRKLSTVRQELGVAEEALEFQSFGFYESQYNFLTSADYLIQLESIKKRQKQLIKSRSAVLCSTNWSILSSEKDGAKFMEGFQKLILTVFNENCDEIISKTRPGKIEKSRLSIEKKFLSLNKISGIIHCEITRKYLDLKFIQLDLIYEMELIKKEEKEKAQQALGDKKVRDAIEKAEREKQAADARAQSYRQKIDDIRRQLESSYQEEIILVGQQKEHLEDQVTKLSELLKQAQADSEAAENSSRMFKAGYVFVISNIGSLGKDMYRICSTRRSNEDSHIPEMAPVVPFPFDIHFKFFSSDVNESIKLLHEKFKDYRVNTANSRRDFFKISIEEIETAIKDLQQKTGNVKDITYNKNPEAGEYYQTQAKLKA